MAVNLSDVFYDSLHMGLPMDSQRSIKIPSELFSILQIFQYQVQTSVHQKVDFWQVILLLCGNLCGNINKLQELHANWIENFEGNVS